MISSSLLKKENGQIASLPGRRIFPLPHPPKSFLSLLREERELSQRNFARLLGIPRSYLQRLESKPWEDLCLKELQLLAKGLGMKIEQLIHLYHTKESGNGILSRCSLAEPFSVIDCVEGIKLASLLRDTQSCFVGSLSLEARKGLSKDQTPQGPFLFCLVLEGILVVNVYSKEHVFKEKECFAIADAHPYELYNPHQIRRAVLFFSKIRGAES